MKKSAAMTTGPQVSSLPRYSLDRLPLRRNKLASWGPPRPLLTVFKEFYPGGAPQEKTLKRFYLYLLFRHPPFLKVTRGTPLRYYKTLIPVLWL